MVLVSFGMRQGYSQTSITDYSLNTDFSHCTATFLQSPQSANFSGFVGENRNAHKTESPCKSNFRQLIIAIGHEPLFLLKFYHINRKYRFYTETWIVKNEP